MACERVDLCVLVVDDDDANRTITANMLMYWKYKVLTASSAYNALDTLRKFEGNFDLVVSDLHLSGMTGFEFQKLVKDEFQLPVIMVSADERESVMIKSMENGASLYILKPICVDDFKDIWQYARKQKSFTENDEDMSRGKRSPNDDNTVFHAVKSSVSLPKNGKRKDQNGETRVMKKSKIVWTTEMHSKFVNAVNKIGLHRAAPRQILDIMNMPLLTRQNVASHLQKYRMFVETARMEGLSKRVQKSSFAYGLSASMIQEIQTRGYGGGNGLMTSAKNYGSSLGNYSFNSGMGNGDVGYYLSCASLSLNDGSKMVAPILVYNKNDYGFINGTQSDENKNLDEMPFSLASKYNVGDVSASGIPTSFITNDGNISEIPQFPEPKDGNIVETEEADISFTEDEISKFYLSLGDFCSLDEIEENYNGSEKVVSEAVPPLEQLQGDESGNKISMDCDSTERVQGGSVYSASNSASEEDWDMDFVEAMLATEN